MKKNILVNMCAVVFGICGTINAGETAVILKDGTENSAFSVKHVDGKSIMRVQGDGNVSLGIDTVASGSVSTAMGNNTIASGSQSTAMGESTIASGFKSTAMGRSTTAKSFVETVIGTFNTDYTPASIFSFVSDDRLFVIGNGFEDSSRSDAMVVLKNGNIGIGTSEPDIKMHVDTAGGDATLRISSDDAGKASLELFEQDDSFGFEFEYDGNDDKLNLRSRDFSNNEAERMTWLKDGNVGIGRTTPTHPLHMGSGANVTSGGVWTNASSREYKENIKNLSLENAINTLNELNPVTFNYKIDKSENYVGFVAEDVPELVSTQDRKGLSPMDITAVLTKVVKEQQRIISELSERVKLLESSL